MDEQKLAQQELNNSRAIAITRLVVSLLTVANFFFAAYGWNPLPFEYEDLYPIISTIVAVIATCWAWWKNNNMTKAAVEAQDVLDDLKRDQTDDHKVGGSE